MTKISQLPATTGSRSGDKIPIVNADTGATERSTVAVIGMPPGAMAPYAGLTAPTGWLLCYGQEVSTSTYPDLYLALGATYGVATAGFFKLPDMRGRVIAGQDDMGGTSANRLTGQSGGVDGDVMGATGGAERHTLTNAETPVHSVTLSHHGDEGGSIVRQFSAGGGTAGGTNIGSYRTPPVATGGANSIQSPSASWGADGPHNNVQPTIILNYIIRY